MQTLRTFLFLNLIFLSFCVSSQGLQFHGFAETGLLAGTNGRIPFWMLTNRFGRFSPKSANGYIDAGIFSDSIDKKRVTAIDWGLEGFGRYDGGWDGWLQQAWAGAKWKKFYFYAGLKEEHFGSQNPEMSSGMVMWSGNARPLPQISLTTIDYIDVPFTNRFVQFNAGISHGWFGNNGYVKQAYLHHKYFYLRFGGESRIHLTIGLQHFAVWGGISPKYGRLPSSLADFFKVFIAYNGHNDSIPGVPPNEWKNRFGDHRGTKDISVDYKFNDNWTTQLYWQNFIEDIMGLGWRQAIDGLWGISFKYKTKLNFCYEYLHSSLNNASFKNAISQGNFQDILDFKDYFNNSIYLSGWTYKGYLIGNPMISSPILLSDPSIAPKIVNNRVNGHIVSSSLTLDKFQLFVRFSHTKNFGSLTWAIDPPKFQNGLMISVSKQRFLFDRIDASISVAMDAGALYGNHLGFEYKMRWNY